MNFIASLIGLLCLAVQHGSFAAQHKRGLHAAQHKRGLQVLCEGREAVIHFVFPRGDNDVALQIGNRAPFYKNGRLLESGLSKEQFKRFQVKPSSNHTHYELTLSISNVSREDEGTYVGLVYVYGEIETSLTKKFALVIEYPPGNLRCKYISSSNVDAISSTWDIIECTADRGTMPGYIACFQDGEAMPLNGRLSKNTTTLLQQIWVKRYKPISCCSPYFEDVVNSDNCNAFYIKTESIPTTIAEYGTRNSSHYITDEMSASFSEDTLTTIYTFANQYDISSHKFSVFDIMVLSGICLILMIMVLLMIKLVKIQRAVRESYLVVQQLESRGKKVDENIVKDQGNKVEDSIKKYMKGVKWDIINEIKKISRNKSLSGSLSFTQALDHKDDKIPRSYHSDGRNGLLDLSDSEINKINSEILD